MGQNIYELRSKDAQVVLKKAPARMITFGSFGIFLILLIIFWGMSQFNVAEKYTRQCFFTGIDKFKKDTSVDLFISIGQVTGQPLLKKQDTVYVSARNLLEAKVVVLDTGKEIYGNQIHLRLEFSKLAPAVRSSWSSYCENVHVEEGTLVSFGTKQSIFRLVFNKVTNQNR